jgi:hypothetical protein
MCERAGFAVNGVPIQGRIYICGGPGAIKMWRSLSVKTNLGYGTYFIVLIYYN